MSNWVFLEWFKRWLAQKHLDSVAQTPLTLESSGVINTAFSLSSFSLWCSRTHLNNKNTENSELNCTITRKILQLHLSLLLFWWGPNSQNKYNTVLNKMFTEVKGQMGNTAFLTRGVAPCWPADLFTESTALKNSCVFILTPVVMYLNLYTKITQKRN